jgi:3-methyladenine DNA glycosylase/8-oxoguanine DNA glycosylase
MPVVEDVITPRGPYRLALVTRRARWEGRLPNGPAVAWQRNDGSVVVRAPDPEGLDRARFMLALDSDTSEFHRRFRSDPLLGPSARALVGYRPPRTATVAHAVLRAVCGQLVEAHRAKAIERAIITSLGEQVPSRERLAAVAPVTLRRCGLAQHRASCLVRLARTIDLERLREVPPSSVDARLGREHGIGPWSLGVVATDGLGRYDLGLVGDLGLMKLAASIWDRWPEPEETAALLAPYGEWQGLACTMLMLGWGKGLVPGADADRGRATRVRARRAA